MKGDIMEKKKTIIFVIYGKARSGKNTVSNYIKEYYNKNNLKTIDLMYAESIKNYTKKILNWDGLEETKPRTFLQQLGTEIIRNKIDNNFFINRMLQDIEVYSYFFDVIVITDARLKEEIEVPYNKYEKVIRIKIERNKSDLTEKQKQHITETALNDYEKYDYKIENNGTLEQLRNKVNNILNEVK